MRLVIEIESKFLLEVVPHYYKTKDIEDTTNKKYAQGCGQKLKNFNSNF